MSEVVYQYRGVQLWQTHRGFEVVENGRLLAVVKMNVVAERLFLYRALALATAEVEQMQQQAAFTEEGKRVFFPNSPDRPADGHLRSPRNGPPLSATQTFPPLSGESPLGKGGKKKTSTAFVKPTVEEIDAYCAERKNGLSGQAIYDHYEANGWMVGRVKMKDWKAAVRTWEKKAAEFAPPSAPKKGVALTNPTHSSLDINAYEDEVLQFRPKFRKGESDDG